jgi:hypothetical protein
MGKHLYEPWKRRRNAGASTRAATGRTPRRDLDDMLNARHSLFGHVGVGRPHTNEAGSRGGLAGSIAGVVIIGAVPASVFLLSLWYGFSEGGLLGGVTVVLLVVFVTVAGLVIVAGVLFGLTGFALVLSMPGRLLRLVRGARGAR